LGDLFEMTWRWVYQLQYLSNRLPPYYYC
jgi:hypothetical protein